MDQIPETGDRTGVITMYLQEPCRSAIHAPMAPTSSVSAVDLICSLPQGFDGWRIRLKRWMLSRGFHSNCKSKGTVGTDQGQGLQLKWGKRMASPGPQV